MVKGLFSVVIPVYGNEGSIEELVDAVGQAARAIRSRYGLTTEAVFVVDGSPDRSCELLARLLPLAPFPSKLLLHARNFGSFPAIRSGLAAATGDYFGVIAADLQEPPDILPAFIDKLIGGAHDVVMGYREGRNDPLMTRLMSALFWRLYRRFVMPDIPSKGVDVFGCNRAFRDRLLTLEECHTSLVGQIYWLGYRRAEVSYCRQERKHGKSAWTLRRKLKYLFDSIFSFTDLPVRLLAVFGGLGVLASLILGVIVLVARITNNIEVPGYAGTALLVMFFGGINALGLGVVGSYAWRAYENTKHRPLSIVMTESQFAGQSI